MTNTMRIKSLLVVLYAATLGTAFATSREWSGGDGGDLATDSNWTVTGEGTTTNFFRTGGLGLTLSENYTLSNRVQVETDGSHLTFDLGADKTLTFADLYFCNAHNTTVELLSGRFETPQGKDFTPCSGDGWGYRNNNNTFRIKGKDTYFNAKGRFMVAYNSNNATVEITDGAYFNVTSTGNFNTGNGNPADTTVNILNGATLYSDQGYAFTANTRLRTIVSNATMTIVNGWSAGTEGGKDCFVGVYDGGKLTIEKGHVFLAGPRAKMVVDGEGSEATASVSLYVGMKNHSEVTFAVTNNGYAYFPRGVYVGGKWRVDGNDKPYSSVSNFVHVTTGGLLSCNGATYVDEAMTVGDYYDKGDSASLADESLQGNINNGFSRVLVENGGDITNGGWYAIVLGNKSSSNRVEVAAGGHFYNVGPVRIGYHPEAKGNVLRVSDGGLFEQNGSGFWLGQKGGSSNSIEVANATFTFGNWDQHIYIGYTNCTGNAMRILPNGKFLGRSGEKKERSGVVYVGNAYSTEDPAPGHDSLLEVLGGELSVKQVQVGVNGSSGNTVVISNGTVDVSYFVSSHSETANTLVIKGTNSLLKADTINLTANSEVVFDFADGVYTSAPLLGGVNIRDGALVRFENTAHLHNAENRRCELARNDDKEIEITDETLAAWRNALPERCRLSLSSDRKVLSFAASNNGLAISVR